jgi:transcriptional regulator with XRE-family HTH domain
MARRSKPGSQHTGLYYAREARGMSRSELVRLSGVSKQQLSRLENGLIRLRLDHLAPFAPHLGYTPEQMLLWGRFPGTEMPESSENPAAEPLLPCVAELDTPATTPTRTMVIPIDLHTRSAAFYDGTTTGRSMRGRQHDTHNRLRRACDR